LLCYINYIDNAPEHNMTSLQQAARLYNQYKTTTPQYKALAAQLGYPSSGDLNAYFSRRRSAKWEAKRLSNLNRA
jgi:hypothetical protein